MEYLCIQATYDEEIPIGIAVQESLGLATEADTLDVYTYKLQEMIPELAKLNGITMPEPPEFVIESRRKAIAFA